MANRKEAIERRRAFLDDFYLKPKTNEQFTAVALAIQYGITPKFLKTLIKYNVIKKIGGGRNVSWEWIHNSEPDAVLAERMYILNARDNLKIAAAETTSTVISSGEIISEEDCKKKHGLSKIIQLSELGLRYGISGPRLELFVKDSLTLFSSIK